jgi:hypothetical protein
MVRRINRERGGYRRRNRIGGETHELERERFAELVAILFLLDLFQQFLP